MLQTIDPFRFWVLVSRTPPRASVRLLALTALATGIAGTNATVSKKRSRQTIFDSDSFDILVDSGATSCISNNPSNFITLLFELQGFNGTASSTKVGTVLWSIFNDSGRR